MDRKERLFLGFSYARKTLPCIDGDSACPYVETWFKQDLASAGSVETTHAGIGVAATSSPGRRSPTPRTARTIPRISLLTGETKYSYDAIGCPTLPCAQEKRAA